jgi:HlyD family secretion protein
MTSTSDVGDLESVLASGDAQGRAKKWFLGLLAVVLVCVALATRIALRTGVPATPAFVTELVTRGDMEIRVSATGNLQPTNTVEVGSELSGLVETVLVDENDTVRKGQILLRLDTAKLRDQIARSEAAVASARARLAQAEATVRESTANLERLREVSRLSGGRVPSQAEMTTAEATLARAAGEDASARAAVAESEAALQTDRTNLDKASIRSPIDGIVLSRAVEPGQAVAASFQVTTLFKIAEDLKQMELKVDVDEADVGRVRPGMRATFAVDAYPSRRYDADVTRVAFGSTKSADVVSYATVLRVRNDDLSLRPGMTASTDIASESVSQALLVPNAALRFTPAQTPAAIGGGGIISSILPGPPREPEKNATAAADAPKQVWVLQGLTPVAVPVEVGETNGRFTVVRRGALIEGTAVITDLAQGGS